MMSASPNGMAEQSKKRVREEEKDRGAEKRRKKESAVLLKEEISIRTYFSLSSQFLINNKQWEIWKDFIKVLSEFIFPEDIYIDDSNLHVIWVAPKVVIILKEMRYDKIDVAELTKQLRERQSQFIDILSRLKHSPEKDVQGREPFFEQLKELVKKGVLNLTLTEPTGWNIAHISMGFGRPDILICIQQYLLPGNLEQYKTLLRAETNRSKAKPADMEEAPYYKQNISLLNEEDLPLLKKKQLVVILEMLIAEKEASQFGTLYEHARWLIAEGVDSTVTEPTRGWTILHHAVYKNYRGLVGHILGYASLGQSKILLRAKTKKTKSTVFSIANSYGYKEIISLLEKKQDEIFKEESAAIFIELAKLERIKDKELLYKRIKEFIKDGGDPMVTSDNGWGFLHYAVNFNDIVLARRIKESITPAQYEVLLCAETKELKVTPYQMAVNRNEKGIKNEGLLQLLKPQIDKDISQPLEQFNGKFTFFKSAMSLDELCQRLNDCVAVLGEFKIQPISAEEEPNLRMPYFTDNEETIDEFIRVLEECSIIVSKNSNGSENSFIMVRGVEDRDRFLNNKVKLTRFAEDHPSTFEIPSITI
jgi:hypothetical protein